MPKRLLLLLSLLLAAAAGLAFLRLRPTPEAREREYSHWSPERLEKEASRRPGDPHLLFILARKRLETGDPAAAETALEEALSADPKFARARAALGTVLLSMDRDPEAVLQLKQAVKDDPELPDGYLGLALLYRRNEAWALQDQAAEIATQLAPENPHAWLLKGEAASRQGDHEKAAACYDRAGRLQPAEANPRALEAREQLALGNFARAEELAREGIRVEPKFAPAHTALGETLMRAGRARYPEAEEAFSRGAALGDDSGRAHLGLGRVLLLLNRPAEAEQQYRLATRDHPQMSEAHYGLAQALRAEGKSGEAAGAEKEFRRWTQFKEEAAKLHDEMLLNPEDARRWFSLARLYAGMRLWTDARRMAVAGLRRAPTDPEGQKLLAQIERNAG
jgi:tetratricopeptide (TPR) repeat protein